MTISIFPNSLDRCLRVVMLTAAAVDTDRRKKASHQPLARDDGQKSSYKDSGRMARLPSGEVPFINPHILTHLKTNSFCSHFLLILVEPKCVYSMFDS